MKPFRPLLCALLVLSLLLVIVSPTLTLVHAETWYNSSWTYRKSHVINARANTGPNFQVQILCKYGSGTDSGATVYLNSHSQTDFDDIRFTDDDKTTLLDHYAQKLIVGTECYFWIEIKDDLTTNPATIYIYYGNAGASSASNGANTFLVYQSFDGQWHNAGNWDYSTNDADYIHQNDTVTYKTSPNAAELAYPISGTGLGVNALCQFQKSYTMAATHYVEIDVWEYHNDNYNTTGKHNIAIGISSSQQYYDMNLLKGQWNYKTLIQQWTTGVKTLLLIMVTSDAHALGAGIYFDVRWDEYFVRMYSSSGDPTQGAWSYEISRYATIIYYTTNGVAYLSGTEGTAFSAVVNGSTYQMGGHVLTLYALPSSNKTYVNMIVNGTTYKTSNPDTVSGTYNTTVWICFGTPPAPFTPVGNATEADVLDGQTFYNNSTTIRTGSYVPPVLTGNATESQVLAGQTFYNNSTSAKRTGSYVPPVFSFLGNATSAYVFSGYSFYSNSSTLRYGTYVIPANPGYDVAGMVLGLIALAVVVMWFIGSKN